MSAPGCFGSPTAITPGERECVHCPVFDGCLERARGCLAEIEDAIDDGRLTRMWRKLSIGQVRGPASICALSGPQKPTPADNPTSTLPSGVEKEKNFPKKALHLMKRLSQTGLDHHGLLSSGVNPFENTKPAFMRVVGAVLLSGGFTKKALKEALMNELSWREGTASAHVSLSVPALMEMNIIEERGGVFTIRNAA